MDVAASIRTCPCVSLISFVGVIQHHVCMCVCVFVWMRVPSNNVRPVFQFFFLVVDDPSSSSSSSSSTASWVLWNIILPSLQSFSISAIMVSIACRNSLRGTIRVPVSRRLVIEESVRCFKLASWIPLSMLLLVLSTHLGTRTTGVAFVAHFILPRLSTFTMSEALYQ